jgi:hypothetical protein
MAANSERRVATLLIALSGSMLRSASSRHFAHYMIDLDWLGTIVVIKRLSLSAVLFKKAGPVQFVRVYFYRLRYC